MPQLTPQVLAYPGVVPWLPRYSIPGDSPLIDQLMPIPGVRYRKSLSLWDIPLEVAEMYGLPPAPTSAVESSRLPNRHSLLHPYQAGALDKVVREGGFGLVNFEMGLGKTPTALHLCLGTTLVVCPAVVRQHWKDKILEWTHWTEAHIEVIEDGEQAKDSEGRQFTVVSYDLVQKLPANFRWDTLIVDELHYIKEERNDRSQIVASLRPRVGNIVGLTATCLPNEPSDLWHQLDVVWEDRFGRDFWEFASRYCHIEEGDFGLKIKGLNPAHSQELRTRLSMAAIRVTKKEVAHLLPPVTAKTIRVKTSRSLKDDLRRYEANLFENFRDHEKSLDSFVEKVSQAKLDTTVELAEAALKGGESHVMILTHFKSTAHTLANQLGAECIDGDVPPAKRLEVLAQQSKKPTSITVATMHSIGIGIDCAFVTYAVFAELYWQPAVMSQAIGRFQRLNSKLPVTLVVLIASGTLDEKIAHTLSTKMKALTALMDPGIAEKDLHSAVQGAELTASEFIERMKEVTEAMVEEDPFFR